MLGHVGRESKRTLKWASVPGLSRAEDARTPDSAEPPDSWLPCESTWVRSRGSKANTEMLQVFIGVAALAAHAFALPVHLSGSTNLASYSFDSYILDFGKVARSAALGVVTRRRPAML